MAALDWLAICGYFAVMLLIGYWSHNQHADRHPGAWD
jgi:hypothetical protein